MKVPTATMLSGSGSRPCWGPKFRLLSSASTGPLATGVTLVTLSPTFCGGPEKQGRLVGACFGFLLAVGIILNKNKGVPADYFCQVPNLLLGYCAIS